MPVRLRRCHEAFSKKGSPPSHVAREANDGLAAAETSGEDPLLRAHALALKSCDYCK